VRLRQQPIRRLIDGRNHPSDDPGRVHLKPDLRDREITTRLRSCALCFFFCHFQFRYSLPFVFYPRPLILLHYSVAFAWCKFECTTI
jgi:hypothetical protein